MAYRIALNFEDGATRFIDCNAGEKVLDAAYRHKINLPMDCSDGVCGTCKCRCEQGRYDLGDEFVEDALSEAESEDRFVLTCQMQALSDCVIAVPAPSGACKIKPSSQAGEVVGIEHVSEGTFVLRVRLDQPDALIFLPGQYVNIVVPGTPHHRAYSFSSKPGATEASFLIRNLPGGLMSAWLTSEAHPGDRISMTGPYGSFFLRQVERPIVMLAGGTGLAPILSMLETLADAGTDQPIHLIYGVTRDRDLVEIERLERLAARLPRMTWSATVADQTSSYSNKGYVTQHLTDEQLNAGNCDIYLCGPPPMVEAVRAFLVAKGQSLAHFHFEKFSASEPS